MAALGTENVISVHHWNDTLFSFRACALKTAISS